jgi:hypothetical protein
MSIVNNTLDVVAGGVALGTIVQVLPAVAALFTCVWLGVRIYIAMRDELGFFKKKEDKDGNV